MKTVKPRRSALYMPAINERAMNKAASLDADVVILDLEDAVSPLQKAEARDLLVKQLGSVDYAWRELVARVNGVGTEWFADDVQAVAKLPVAAVALPKVESAAAVNTLSEALAAAGASDSIRIWPMIETPAGVLAAQEIACCSKQVDCLVMGTSDLSKDLQLCDASDRKGLLYSLSHCVLAARAARIDILDGVCLDLADSELFACHCRQGAELGFTGKTLIHPRQIEASNEVFGVDEQQVAQAGKILSAWEEAQRQGKGIAVVDDKLVESLHVEDALRITGLAEAIALRE